MDFFSKILIWWFPIIYRLKVFSTCSVTLRSVLISDPQDYLLFTYHIFQKHKYCVNFFMLMTVRWPGEKPHPLLFPQFYMVFIVRNLCSLNYMPINKSISKLIIAETEYDLWYDSFLKIVLWFYILIDVKDIRKKLSNFLHFLDLTILNTLWPQPQYFIIGMSTAHSASVYSLFFALCLLSVPPLSFP